MSAPIPLIKHPSGDVCVRLDRQQEQHTINGQGDKGAPPLKLVRGSHAVHSRLQSLQHQLMWRTVSQCMEEEAQAGAATSNFTYSLALQVLAALSSPSASHQMSALRPLVLEHVNMCKLPLPIIAPPVRPHNLAPSSAALLPELSSWISHSFYRDNMYTLLDAQAHQLPMIRLHWVPTTQPCTSAIQICLTNSHRLMMILSDKSVEIEGIPSPSGTRSRWAREGVVSITKLEVPHLLMSLIQQAFGSSA